MKWSQRSLGWQVGGLILLLTLSAGACRHKGNGQEAVASSPKAPVAPDPDPAPSPGVSADNPPSAEPVAIAEPAPASGSNAWAIPARDALLRASCARCHNGSLPTSVPAALAIYNLVEDPWFGRLEPGHYEGILRRVTGSTSFPEADKTAIVNFVHCAREGACEPAPTADPSSAKLSERD